MEPRALQPRASRIYGCLLLLVLLVTPLSVIADDEVTFCYVDWPPYTEMSESGVDGITVRIIRRAAQLIDRKVRFVQREWTECLEQVEQGGLDVILDAAKRDAYLQGPTSFNSYIDTFWVNNSSQINRYDQLSGGRVALVDGYNYDDRLHAHLKDLNAEVLRGKDDPSNLQDLSKKRIDATVADLASTFFYTHQHSLEIHPILPPFTADRLYASFNRDLVELQREFDQAFASLIEQGYVDEVYMEFIGTTFSSFAATQ